MAEQWIAAGTALGIVSGLSGEREARRALCERAHAGLIRKRARILASGDRQVENVDVPVTFWWARGYEALKQNWESSDFSTWIKEREEWRGFGVTFVLGGVLEMLPFEQRAVTARRLSVAGNPAWMPARGALRFARKEGGIAAGRAEKAIFEQAQLGFVTGRAVLAQRFDGPILSKDPSWEEREWDVPDWFWRGSNIEDHSRQDWERGWFSAEGLGPDGDCLMNLTGGDCQDSCAGGHDDGERGSQPWPSRKTSWTSFWQGVTRRRFSGATVSSTS